METVKGSVGEGLRRELSEKQYAEFEEWGLDPTEIQDITNTPWADFEARVGVSRGDVGGSTLGPIERTWC